jgi:hypothetical protein
VEETNFHASTPLIVSQFLSYQFGKNASQVDTFV